MHCDKCHCDREVIFTSGVIVIENVCPQCSSMGTSAKKIQGQVPRTPEEGTDMVTKAKQAAVTLVRSWSVLVSVEREGMLFMEVRFQAYTRGNKGRSCWERQCPQFARPRKQCLIITSKLFELMKNRWNDGSGFKLRSWVRSQETWWSHQGMWVEKVWSGAHLWLNVYSSLLGTLGSGNTSHSFVGRCSECHSQAVLGSVPSRAPWVANGSVENCWENWPWNLTPRFQPLLCHFLLRGNHLISVLSLLMCETRAILVSAA